MSTDLVVRSAQVKRQGLGAWIGLAIITLGIYTFFWYYRVNREMRDIGASYGDEELASVRPGLSVLAMLVPIVNFVSFHKTGRRIQRVQALTGGFGDYSLVVHWLLMIFTGLWPLYSQSVLNGVWERAAATSAATPSGTNPVLPVGAAATGTGDAPHQV